MIGFLCVGPLILPLVWLNPQYSGRKKLIASFLILLVTWILIKAMASMIPYYKEYYEILQNIYG